MHAVLILSGGLDSSVLLYDLLNQGARVDALTVNYGQRHAREIESARELCRLRGVTHEVADLRALRPLLAGSALTDDAVALPAGHYEEASMKATVVPNRNMLLLAVAGAWALSRKAECVAYAAHGGDHAIYPDCRPEFAEALDKALGLADWHPMRLHRPYVALSKALIVRRGAELGLPFERTWSCYSGGTVHCGRCGTCVERREAFHLAGVDDPTPYAPEAPPLAELLARKGL